MSKGQTPVKVICELVADGAGWRFLAVPSGTWYSNIKAGWYLIHEPWKSGWKLAGDDPWSISTGRNHAKRMGIPHDAAIALLEAAGVDYSVCSGKYVPV
jgi:hypothetical protein